MATAVQMPRPSMDRSPSFDQPRSRSTPPFSAHQHHSNHYDLSRSTSPNSTNHHSRTSSNASASSPYAQPFNHNYFPQQAPMFNVGLGMQHSQAWTTSAIPATAFYPSPMQLHPGQSFQQNFQQSQADFAAWATAYHQMVASSMASGQNVNVPNGQGMMPPRPEYLSERRRTSSGPSSSTPFSHAQAYQEHNAHSQPKQSSRAIHPYQRTHSHSSSRESLPSGISRSMSQPSLVSTDSRQSHSSQVSTPTQESHRRASSLESSGPYASVQAPPRLTSRQDSHRSEEERGRSTPSTPTATRTASPAPTPKAVPQASTPKPAPVQERPKAPQPLHSGPIANATNTPNPVPSSRPSPLSQTTNVEPEKKSGGLKNRLRRVLDKDASTPKKQTSSIAVSHGNVKQSVFTSPSETSTRSATPPITPPQTADLPPPNRPFVSHSQAMNSEISLAETDRTATAPNDMNTGKSKKSLFRMKNMSTDNISLSSTVSSASMMIRKMGSIGKLARRNSLMGISKIFKDKPKDEDAALPQKEGKKKKKDKKDKTKAEVTPAVVSHATAEPDRISGEEDRALAGLSPAAKLARQHTLRSRQEQERKARANKTGEPAWDNNTATRNNNVLPSISAVAGSEPGLAPEVVHITPGRTSTVVHAVQVSEQEYDSEDDSSDGETVEDVSLQLSRARLSDSSAADAEFRDTWGNVWIDRYAVPKKGILKNSVSMEALTSNGPLDARQRSNSTAQLPVISSPHPMMQPQADADQIDGLHHPTAAHPSPNEQKYDPFSSSFAPFESPSETPELHFPYSNPAHNTSAPTLSLMHPGKPLNPRSMTAPAKRRLLWAPECAVYSTYDALTYDRRSEPATCNRLTPELAQQIKHELNTFKLEMPIHPDSRGHTHFFA